MLIVLRKLLKLVLVVREAGVNTEIPVSAFGQVPLLLCHWLWDMEGRGVLVA